MSTHEQEMKLKYPNRPYVTSPTWELLNIKKALSTMQVLNTEEEEERLFLVTQELDFRRTKQAA